MDPGSWGIELWDQSDTLLKHSADQVASTEIYYKLLLDFQKLQHEFGKKLRKLMATYLPKKQPAHGDSTYDTAFCGLVQSLSDMGAVLECNAKDVTEHATSFKQLYESDRKDLDNRRANLMRLNQSLEQARKQLDSAWQKYLFAYKDKQKAYETSLKADKDMQLPRIDQQRFREIYHRKQHIFDQTKAQYASELNTYNKVLRQHYSKSLVDFLEDLCLKDRNRIEQTREILEQLNTVNGSMCTQLSDCVKSMQETVSTIDARKDNDFVVARYKSDELPPVDLPFLDFDACPPSLLEATPQILLSFLVGVEAPQPAAQPPDPSPVSGGAGMFSSLKRASAKTFREDSVNLRTPFICDISLKGMKCGDMTIIQLADRLHELSEQVKRTEAEMQGTQRLLDAYRNNPLLGSPSAVEPKEEMLKKRLVSLNEHIRQIQERYVELGGDAALKEAQTRLVKMQSVNADAKPHSIGSNTNPTNIDSDDSFDSEPEESPLTQMANSNYVGYAIAKYEYQGDGPNYLAAKPGDRFHIVKFDTDNIGWTLVVSEDESQQGFLPTAFIEVKQYS